MKKNVKGITLVSMVITIIVMLILAGVSISMVTGENGVVTRASEGSVKTKVASIESDLGLAISSLQTDYMNDWTNDASITASKDDYFTVGTLGTPGNRPARSNHRGMNDYLSECQIITGDGITNEGGDYIVSGATNATTFNALSGETEGTDNQFAIYLTNGTEPDTIDSDLYIAVFYMEDGVPKLVDVGLIQMPAEGGYTQGTADYGEDGDITWLDDGVDVDFGE